MIQFKLYTQINISQDHNINYVVVIYIYIFSLNAILYS